MKPDEKLNMPVVSSFGPASDIVGVPEIENVNYDLWFLRILLRFPDRKSPVYVEFDGMVGFRVLDEGDLLEFWNPQVRADGWLWEVGSGGWFDLEKHRKGFLSGVTDGYREFLIGGINDCVSVISYEEPKIICPT